MVINVLSLFDGIGCGRLALKRAGIKVEKYYASEIDKGEITIATANHDDIIEIGDITKISYDKNSETLHTENGDYNVGKIVNKKETIEQTKMFDEMLKTADRMIKGGMDDRSRI